MLHAPPYDLGEVLRRISRLLSEGPRTQPAAVPVGTRRLQPSLGALEHQLLDLLIRVRRPAAILQVGAEQGSTTAVLARAARNHGGHVVALEADGPSCSVTRARLTAMRVADCVEILPFKPAEWIPTCRQRFEMILLSGDPAAYDALLPQLADLLTSGGLLLTEDTLEPVLDLPPSTQCWRSVMDHYNDSLRQHPQLRTTWLPIGHGLALSVKTEDQPLPDPSCDSGVMHPLTA